uniref:BRX domain-containing protein n=1 Tax=Brassica campestris TaxID=3711 RepID=M4FD11_BRACM
MPDYMRGYGQSVDQLDRSLVWSIKRPRAVTPSTLSEVLIGLGERFGETNARLWWEERKVRMQQHYLLREVRMQQHIKLTKR